MRPEGSTMGSDLEALVPPVTGTGAVDPLPLSASTAESFRTVFENSRDGINLLDLTTGRYRLMNAAQIAMTGFSLEEIHAISEEEACARTRTLARVGCTADRTQGANHACCRQSPPFGHGPVSSDWG